MSLIDGQVIAAARQRYGDAAVDAQLSALQAHAELVEDPALWFHTALKYRFKRIPLTAVRNCPCGSRDTRLLCRFVHWNLLGVRECVACGLLFVSPRPTPEMARRFFSEGYFDYSDLEFWGARRVAIFEEVLALLRERRCRSLFDVGAAYGHFVKWARDHGIEAAGTDISERAVELGRERLGVPLHAGALRELDLPAGFVDSVVSLDTLYYVDDPVEELRAMRRLVRSGGYLILRLRNGLWSRARARWERSRPVGHAVMPHEHLWAFTPAATILLLEIAGWRPERCEPAAYSRSALLPGHITILAFNRFARRARPATPILTRSFTVVAQRAD